MRRSRSAATPNRACKLQSLYQRLAIHLELYRITLVIALARGTLAALNVLLVIPYMDRVYT